VYPECGGAMFTEPTEEDVLREIAEERDAMAVDELVDAIEAARAGGPWSEVLVRSGLRADEVDGVGDSHALAREVLWRGRIDLEDEGFDYPSMA
jgi:hypothetical protein